MLLKQFVVMAIGSKLIHRNTISEFRVLQMIQVKEMHMFCEVSVVNYVSEQVICNDAEMDYLVCSNVE